MTRAAGGPQGQGPGSLTKDGCSVEVYSRLSAAGEPDLIHARVPAGSSVLDLGAGTGRIADPLCELGHRVTAVDNSPEMLALVRHAEPVLSNIEDLELGRSFGVVLLASNLISQPGADHRGRLFGVIAAHLDNGGQALLQWHSPAWFDHWTVGQTYHGAVGPFTTEFTVHRFDGEHLTATITYCLYEKRWSQHFTAQRLGVEDLSAELSRAGLRLCALFGPGDSWVEATVASERS